MRIQNPHAPRSRATLAALCLLFTLPRAWADPRDADVQQVVSRFQESLFKYDATAADPILARGFVWVSQGGKIMERSDWLQALKTQRIGNKFKNSAQRVQLHEDTAVVTFTQTPATASGQPGQFVRTLVLRKEAQAGWKVILYQSTPVKNQ